MRGARGLRDEFSTFHASAYPQLAAQTLAITGDAGITRAAAAATLMRVWRSWPSLRGTADVLVRARWTAVLVAAERESTTPVRPQQAGDAVQEITGAAVAADTVVVAALQRLPRVQRRALVLHYLGGVSVRHLSELSGSSAEHIELLLDDGFTALAGSLVWSAADDEHEDLDGPDMSFDWVSEALADTAARLPAQIPAPPPTVLLRNAAVVRWSVRAIPVAGVAACAAVVAAVALPEPAEVHGPAIYVQHGSGAEGVAPIYVSGSDHAHEPAVDGGPSPEPTVRLRSIALTSLLDAPARADAPTSHPGPASPARATSPRAPTGGSADGAATGPMDAGSGGAAGEDGPREAAGSAESAGAGIAAGDAAGTGAGGAAGTAAGGRRDAAGALTGGAGSAASPAASGAAGAVAGGAADAAANGAAGAEAGGPVGVAATRRAGAVPAGAAATGPAGAVPAGAAATGPAAAVPTGAAATGQAAAVPASAVPAGAADRRVAGSAGAAPDVAPAAPAAPGSVPGAGGQPSGAPPALPDAGGPSGAGGVPQPGEVATDAPSRTVTDASTQLRLPGVMAAPVPAPAEVVPNAAAPAAGDPLVLSAVSDPPTSAEKSIAPDTATDPAARLAAAGDPTARHTAEDPSAGQAPAAATPSAQRTTTAAKPAERSVADAAEPTDRRAAAAAKPASRQTAAAGKPAKRAAAEKSAARDTAEEPSARQATGAGKPPARHAATAGKSAQRDTAEKRATQHAPTGGDRPSSDDAAGDRATGAPDD